MDSIASKKNTPMWCHWTSSENPEFIFLFDQQSKMFFYFYITFYKVVLINFFKFTNVFFKLRAKKITYMHRRLIGEKNTKNIHSSFQGCWTRFGSGFIWVRTQTSLSWCSKKTLILMTKWNVFFSEYNITVYPNLWRLVSR